MSGHLQQSHQQMWGSWQQHATTEFPLRLWFHLQNLQNPLADMNQNWPSHLFWTVQMFSWMTAELFRGWFAAPNFTGAQPLSPCGRNSAEFPLIWPVGCGKPLAQKGPSGPTTLTAIVSGANEVRNICHEAINQKGSDLQQLQEEEGLQPTGSGHMWRVVLGRKDEATLYMQINICCMECACVYTHMVLSWMCIQERHQRWLYANLHVSLEFLRTTFSILVSSIKPGNMNTS